MTTETLTQILDSFEWKTSNHTCDCSEMSVSGLKCRNMSEWRRIITRFNGRLLYDLQKTLDSRGDDSGFAKSIVAEVWVTALREIDNFEWKGSTTLYCWLVKIGTNLATAAVRPERSKRSTVSLHMFEDSIANSDLRSSPEEFAEVKDILERCMKAPVLSELSRRILRLKYLQGYAIQEIANVLNKTPDAVYRNHGRAIQRLQSWAAHEFRK